MSTCILYVDESGDVRKHRVPLNNGETPLFTLTGLALPLREWRNIDRELLSLKSQYFEAEINRSSKRHEHYEVKGNTLCSPRNKDSKRRHSYIKTICELVARYEGKLFCVSVIKNPNNPTSEKSTYTSSLQYMAERFNVYINEHKDFDKGLIIADSTKKSFNFNVASSYMSYIFGSETGKLLTHIYEAPLFADSKLTTGLQLVDNMSSIIYTNHYNYYCKNIDGAHSYQHMVQHWAKVQSMEFHSRQKYDGYIKHGFRKIRHDQ